MNDFSIGRKAARAAAFALLALAVPVLAAEGEKPSAEQLEQAALEYRRETIRSGRLTLESVPEPREGQENLVPLTSYTGFEYRIVFDGDRIRFGWQGQHPDRVAPDIDWVILSDGMYISDPGRKFAVRRGRQSDYEDIREHFQVFDPRALGMSTASPPRLADPRFGGPLSRAGRRATAVTRDDIGGVSAWRIDYDLAEIPEGSRVSAATASVWIAPGQGNGAVRAVERFTVGGMTHVAEVRSILKEYPEGGIWYPVETTTSETDGKKRVAGNTVRVVKAEFNVPVDPVEFTLEGLGLEPGRTVLDGNELMRWRGKPSAGTGKGSVGASKETSGTADASREGTDASDDALKS